MIYYFNKNESGYLLKIEGDLDLYSSYNVREEVRSIFAKNPEDITIDLSGLNYIDSAGIAFLIDLKKNTSQYNKQYNVINIPPDILKMLRALRVDVILQIK